MIKLYAVGPLTPALVTAYEDEANDVVRSKPKVANFDNRAHEMCVFISRGLDLDSEDYWIGTLAEECIKYLQGSNNMKDIQRITKYVSKWLIKAK